MSRNNLEENEWKNVPDELKYLVDSYPDWLKNNYKDIDTIISDGNIRGYSNSWSSQNNAIKRIIDACEGTSIDAYVLLSNIVGYLKGFNQSDLITWVKSDNKDALIVLCNNMGKVENERNREIIIEKSIETEQPVLPAGICIAVFNSFRYLKTEFQEEFLHRIPLDNTDVCKALVEHINEINVNRVWPNTFLDIEAQVIRTLKSLGRDNIQTWIREKGLLNSYGKCEKLIMELEKSLDETRTAFETASDEEGAVTAKTEIENQEEESNNSQLIDEFKIDILMDFGNTVKKMAYKDFSTKEIREIFAPINEWTEDKIRVLMMQKSIPFEIIIEKALEVPSLRFMLLRTTEELEDKQKAVSDITTNDQKMGLYYRLLKESQLNMEVNPYLSYLTNGIIEEQRNGNKISYKIYKNDVRGLVISSCIMGMPFNEGEIIRIINNCVYPEERETVENEFRRVLAEVREELKQIGMQEPSVQDPSKGIVTEKASSVPNPDEWTQ